MRRRIKGPAKEVLPGPAQFFHFFGRSDFADRGRVDFTPRPLQMVLSDFDGEALPIFVESQ